MRRIALIYDDVRRPDTTGTYCKRALAGLAEVTHVLPSEVAHVARGGFDLYLEIDDGLEHRLPPELRPCAWWAIDTHLNYDWYRTKARDFDVVFAAQADGALRLRADGIGACHWLPLACDPAIHRQRDAAKRWDWCFVGNLFPGDRTELVRLLERHFPRSFVGRRYFDHMAEAFSASRIVFNRGIRNDVNMRVFEALACGSLLVTNDLADNGQDRFFQDGVHLATYRSADELLDKVRYYLAHEDERERIAAAGRTEVVTRHTYRQRMEVIVSMLLEGRKAEELEMRPAPVAARPAPAPGVGLTSIVIVTCNQLSCTRDCVNSIRLRTDEPYELIFVDNGSTDDTRAYLKSVPRAKVILNDENRGFPAAANQGIRAASGQQVLLLNNDCVVTTGWLRRLLSAMHERPDVGLVGPVSNRVSGVQQVPVTYAALSALDGFAWDWGQRHAGRREATDRLVGFCLLIRRGVIDRIGLLDERFGIGCFEDDDYCRRAIRAGFQAVIARDAFVHHVGGQTFRHSDVDYGALLKTNEALFREKWAAKPVLQAAQAAIATPAPDPAAVPRFALQPAPAGGLLLVPRRPLISLCMIVRDNARTITACLESVKPWVDEMLVVDTGSTDDTPAIVERLGATVYRFPWCDSFSAARNESLRHAGGEWLFWMDSDDVISAENGMKLRELATRAAPPSLLGYVMQVHCPGPDDDGKTDLTVVDHVKLFRNLPELRFQGRIHEQILPAIRRLGGDVAWSDAFVVHAGYDHSSAGQKRKIARDLRLLHLELQEQPDHPFTLFNLGMTYADVGDHERAAGFLRQSVEKAAGGESHLRKAYALWVYCAARCGPLAAALELCEKALRTFPDDVELRFRLGLLLHETGRPTEAVAAYRQVLQAKGDRYFSSMDRGIRGFKARQNLAVVLTDVGDHAAAATEWRLVIEEVPSYRPGWRGLGEALLAGNQWTEISRLSRQMQENPALRCEGLLLEGRLLLAQGSKSEAGKVLEAAAGAYPDDEAALQTLCRFRFEHADRAAAEQALRDLIRVCPEDAAAYHNLAIVLDGRGCLLEAVDAFRESLRLRPRAPHTCYQLGALLDRLGRRADAIAAWEQTLRLQPDHSAARAALGAPGLKAGA